MILKYKNLVFNSSEKSVQYEVYAPNISSKLNLSICSSSNIKIEIYVPVQLNEETQNLYEDLKEQGYDLFNKNDKFYTDICTPYKSENGTDVSLADRYNTFFASNELSCQNNCQYSQYNSETKYLKCECNIINEDEIETNEPEKITAKSLAKSFFKVLKYSNYKVLRCYQLVFREKNLDVNIGMILTFFYFLGYIISFIIFCYNRLNYLKDEIEKLLNKSSKKEKEEKKDINSHKDLIIFNKINFEKNNSKEKLDDKKERSEAKKNDKKNESHHSKHHKRKDRSKTHQDKKHKGIKNKKNHKDFPPKKKSEVINESETTKTNNNNKSDKHHHYHEKEKDKEKHSKNKNKEKTNLIDSQNSLELINSNHEEKKEKDRKSIKNNKINDKIDNKENSEEIKDDKILSDFELNNLEYLVAIENDNRNLFRVYWSILKREHIIIFTFFSLNDFNLFSIKLTKFFFLITTFTV